MTQSQLTGNHNIPELYWSPFRKRIRYTITLEVVCIFWSNDCQYNTQENGGGRKRCGWVELCKHWPDSRRAEICQMGREQQPRKKDCAQEIRDSDGLW